LGRITSINDIPLLDRTKQKWFNRSGEFTREFNITTKLFSLDVYISGWVPGTGEVSLEKDFAERLGIGMWDTIRFFIQWRNFDLRVTSFRVAQRNGLTPFFYMQFPQDQFSGAPKTYFWLANVTWDEKTIFKRSIVENLGPHVSFVDTADIAETITDISSKITLVIQVLLYFLLVFVAISIYVCLESMKVLKELKIQLYQYLWATDGMMKTTLRAELGSIFGIAILTAWIAASSILSFIFSSSDLLMWSSDVILYTLFLIVCVTVAIILLIRLVYNRLIY
jgi:putative ABC transport system permease protein